MRIEKRRVADLTPAHYNPRRDLRPGDPRYEQIKDSLDRFSLVLPLVFNERTHRLVSGHQRVKVLLQEGVEEAEVSVVDVDEQAEMAMNLALNNVEGENDPDQLRVVLSQLENFRGTGFEPEDYAAMTAAFDVDDLQPEGEPSESDYRALSLPFIVQGTGACCMAVAAGLQYGTQSPRKLCGNAAQPKHRITFVDIDLRRYDHDRHLAYCEAVSPRYAATRDVMTKSQCEKAGIPYHPLDRVLRWAEELSLVCEHVVVVPKFDCLHEIPKDYVLGYSVATSYGSTPMPFTAFRGRQVHLLGGSPQKQWEYFRSAPKDVVSIDSNYILRMAAFGQWFDLETMAFRHIDEVTGSRHRQPAMSAALALSALNVAEMFERERLEGQAVDNLVDRILEMPTPYSRVLLGALGLSLSNIAGLFNRAPIEDAMKSLPSRARGTK
ncbi:MAG: hypothetical protein FWC87_00190 [Acidimicrobiaceae bacterium]|nr:hypothetical protein [Acidimicrobiaceae bacterium]